MIPLILSIMLAGFHPTIDGGRVDLDHTQQPPYWLGVSVLPYHEIDITIQHDDLELVLDKYSGTDFYLSYIDSYEPVYFWADGEYKGRIVPEPCSLSFLLTGVFLCRKYRQFRKGKYDG